jgi:hypothetical protein
MAEQTSEKWVPAQTNGGWGAAAATVLLAVACIATATYVHKKTYKHPTDVTWHGVSKAPAHEAASGH